MTTARDLMTSDPQIVGIDATTRQVADLLADEGIGAVAVCNQGKRLQGVITDRDIAVGVVARGKDPEGTTAGTLVDGSEVVTIGADDPVEEAISTMKSKGVRRLPVIDGDEVVGFLSEADLARGIDAEKVKDLVSSIAAQPDNTGVG